MADRIKVVNPNKFDVGIKTQDKPGGMNIRHESFVLLSEDDVNYVASISPIFQRGILRIENAAGAKEDLASEVAMNIGVDLEAPQFADDEEIRKKLSATPKKLAEWLDTVNDPIVLDRIYEIAMTMDLTSQRIAKLKDKMPAKSFIGE